MGIENLTRLLERIRREIKYLELADLSAGRQDRDTGKNG